MMGSNSGKKHHTELVTTTLESRLAKLVKELIKLDRDADRFEERIFCLLSDLEALVADIAGGSVMVPSGRSGKRRQVPADKSRNLLEALALHGVGSLEIRRCVDGFGVVILDGGQPVRLSPKLLDLIEILASYDGVPAGDAFPPWKHKTYIATLLKQKYGNAVSEHSVVQNISRLRKVLRDDGKLNPGFVQTDRRGHYRFLLRQEAPIEQAGYAHPGGSETSHDSM